MKTTKFRDKPPAVNKDAVTSTIGAVFVSSLSEALQRHYSRVYTEQEVKDAFKVREIREFFAREWSRLQTKAREKYITSSRLCWYHRTFRIAHRCKRPCRYNTQVPLSNEVTRNWPCLEHSTMVGAILICRPPCPMQPHRFRKTNSGKPPLQQRSDDRCTP